MNDISNYYACRKDIKTGDILEWDSDTVIGWGIQKRTGKDVNHTSMVVRYSTFDLERVYNLEALGAGVYPNLLSRRLAEFKGKVYWLPLHPSLCKYRSSVAREGHKYVGIKYDYGSIIRQIFGRVSADIHRLFCSELYWQAAVEGGLIKAAERKGLLKKWPKVAPWPGEFESLGFCMTRIRIL